MLLKLYSTNPVFKTLNNIIPCCKYKNAQIKYKFIIHVDTK